jgi:hypothetical protein
MAALLNRIRPRSCNRLQQIGYSRVFSGIDIYIPRHYNALRSARRQRYVRQSHGGGARTEAERPLSVLQCGGGGRIGEIWAESE